ncbi:MAG TPA: methanol/ethanol family PQQ-dependent dehydrogenase [Vicinamibacteria bacterium]|nr:methanol/ethanol family PQQ-dependent dehydrogenase [Vicinamibacteria bacterium]
MKRGSWLALGAMLFLAGGAFANDELLSLQKDDKQWAMAGKNYSSNRYSTLNQITTANVKQLRQVWSFSTGALRGHEGAPLVIGSTMYVHSAFSDSESSPGNHIYALDLAKEGAPIIWHYNPKVDRRAIPVACCDVVQRGLNYVAGKILTTTLDGQVIALDAKTGKEAWKARNADPLKGETMTMAGLVVKDKYIVGVSGGEFGVRGWVAAYNISDGKQAWKAYSMGPDEDVKLAADFNSANPHYGQKGVGTSTWPADQWKIGGGTTWGWYSYDPELNLFYYSTGNPGTWNPTPRKGDNKWSMTIFARNPDTGEAKWAYQMTPWDAWDYDGVNEHILADLTIGGKPVKALVHFDRNGFGYTLDRTNGTLLVAQPFVYTNWAKSIDLKTGRPVEDPAKRTKQGEDTKDICPCAMGGKDQQPAAFSPQTGLFYVPTNNMCMNYEGVEVKYQAGAPYVGANVLMFPGKADMAGAAPDGHLGDFIAWDATTGKRVWTIKEAQPAWSGALATAGGLVFYATLDGWFKAVDAKNGTVLWKSKLASGSIAAPMTYVGPDGKQYVAIYSGPGGWYAAPVAANLAKDDPFGALGAVGVAFGAKLDTATSVGGLLQVFAIQ